METQEITATNNIALSSADLLEHWQGHRNLTRRVIEAFPEDRLFDFRIGSMRTFADIAMELNHMAAPGAHGVATGEWKELSELLKDRGLNPSPTTKTGILEIWDWGTSHMNTIWGELKPGRFQETDKAFGQYEGKVWWLCMYLIDNEIHHRGQGFAYLRSLGIEPPFFWER